jgi:hypothetical protein
VDCDHTEKEPPRKKSRKNLFYLWGNPRREPGKSKEISERAPPWKNRALGDFLLWGAPSGSIVSCVLG